MVNNSNIIKDTNSHLTSQIIKCKKEKETTTYVLENLILAWDKHIFGCFTV